MPKTKTTPIYSEGDTVSTSIAKKREADLDYMNNYTRNFLGRLKKEKTKKVLCSRAYANYFGTTYTALLNLVPVTVKFDGTEQVFPESVADWLMKKFIQVTESNMPKVNNETLSE